MPKTKVPAVISTFCLCFLFWVLLTWSFTPQEMIAGAVVSLAAALFTSGFFIHENAFRLANPVRFGALIAYVFWGTWSPDVVPVMPDTLENDDFIFLGELVKANLDVARRCFGGCREVNPGIVKVPVELEGDYAQAMLANSITLTPGTITLDIAEQDGKTWYYIHWIDVAETDREKAGKIIKGRLEKGIRRIWQ